MTQQGKERENRAIESHFDDGDKQDKAKEIFTYEDGGLSERRGYIPHWLKLVAAALLVWGVYYLWTYWSPPPS